MDLDNENEQTVLDEDEKNKYLLFEVGGGKYAVHISYVNEVVSVDNITFVPGYPEYVRGVIKLRDVTVPIIDFMSLLGKGLSQINKNNYCIIAQYDGHNYGITVNKVADIADFGEDNMEAFDNGSAASEFIKSTVNYNGETIMVLEPAKLLGDSGK